MSSFYTQNTTVGTEIPAPAAAEANETSSRSSFYKDGTLYDEILSGAATGPQGPQGATGPQGVPSSDGSVTNILQMTQAEYDALGTYDATTLYIITA
jgi:hypothetical protein